MISMSVKITGTFPGALKGGGPGDALRANLARGIDRLLGHITTLAKGYAPPPVTVPRERERNQCKINPRRGLDWHWPWQQRIKNGIWTVAASISGQELTGHVVSTPANYPPRGRVPVNIFMEYGTSVRGSATKHPPTPPWYHYGQPVRKNRGMRAQAFMYPALQMVLKGSKYRNIVFSDVLSFFKKGRSRI